ncbi:MAG: thioredoxin [Lachnospiraceae bacterium]|nr:thioredoxin [Lachnospiraceae bacterium]
MVIKVTEENFQTEVMEASMPVLVDFYADWCGPCKMMSPVLEQISDEMEGKIKVAKINVDENPNLASQYKVMSIPNFILFKNGQTADQVIGAIPKAQMQEKINAVL